MACERGDQIVEVHEDLVVATSKDLKALEEIETEGPETRINSRAMLVLAVARGDLELLPPRDVGAQNNAPSRTEE